MAKVKSTLAIKDLKIPLEYLDLPKNIVDEILKQQEIALKEQAEIIAHGSQTEQCPKCGWMPSENSFHNERDFNGTKQIECPHCQLYFNCKFDGFTQRENNFESRFVCPVHGVVRDYFTFNHYTEKYCAACYREVLAENVGILSDYIGDEDDDE